MAYILALDQGTTSCRAVLFDQTGAVCSLAQQEFAQHFPQPGWVEHNAMDIWRSQLAVAQNCIIKSQNRHIKRRHTATDIVAIGIASQRETTVLWSRATGQPVAPAIVWQDRRTTAQCHALQAAGQARGLHAKTGLVADAYFSATKLQWLLDNTPGARQQAERGELAFGTIDCWLVWNLTGGRVHATDASNASRTLLFNIHTLAWDATLLRLFDIPASVLPQVVPSSGVLGHTDTALFGAPIPIAGIAGDQQAATFGQACFTPGMAKNTYGTGCFMLMNTGTTAVKSRNRLLTTVAWAGPADEASPFLLPPGADGNTGQADAGRYVAPALPSVSRRTTCYALEGGVFMAGATVQWLRDGLQIIKTAAEVEPLAASVPDSGDVFLVPAFAGLGAPVWDGHARAIMLGMTRGTHRAHIARAALKAIAFQVADVFDAMARDAALPLTELRVDGGASANNLLMQMQADVLGVPVVRPRITETTALGAAYLAGLATGFWRSADEIAAQWAVDRRFEPQLGAAERTAQRARWQQAVQRARGWAVSV